MKLMKPLKKAIAAALKVSPPRVTAMIKQGMPVYSIEAAVAWYQQHVRAKVAYTPPTAAADSLGGDPAVSWRSRKDRASALLEEMKLDRERGQSHDAADCVAALGKLISIVRNRLLSIPTRIGARLAPAERGRVVDLIEAEVYLALNQLGGGAADE